MINYRFYIFNNLGELLYRNNTKFIINEFPNYNTLTPLVINSNNYYFIIGYYDTRTYLHLNLYKYDIPNNISTNVDLKTYSQLYILYDSSYIFTFKNRGFSCEYLKDRQNSNNRLACFFVASYDSYEYIIAGFYIITENSIDTVTNYRTDFEQL